MGSQSLELKMMMRKWLRLMVNTALLLMGQIGREEILPKKTKGKGMPLQLARFMIGFLRFGFQKLIYDLMILHSTRLIDMRCFKQVPFFYNIVLIRVGIRTLDCTDELLSYVMLILNLDSLFVHTYFWGESSLLFLFSLFREISVETENEVESEDDGEVSDSFSPH